MYNAGFDTGGRMATGEEKEIRRRIDQQWRWMTIGVVAASFTGLISLLQVSEFDTELHVAASAFAAAIPLSGFGALSAAWVAPGLEPSRRVVNLCVAVGTLCVITGIWAVTLHLSQPAALALAAASAIASTMIIRPVVHGWRLVRGVPLRQHVRDAWRVLGGE